MKYLHLHIYLLISLLVCNEICYAKDFANDISYIQPNDSIPIWIKSSKNKSLSFGKRKIYLDKALATLQKEVNDSVENSFLLKISLAYYSLGDSLGFRATNRRSLNLSYRLNDSASIAANYWDLAEFHSKKGIKDSAFYNFSKAEKIYKSVNNYYAGRMLLNMAIIQSDIKDYTGSEITTIKAIALLKPLKKHRHLYRCYNNLGINFNELGDYDEALFYHNKALGHQKQIEKKNVYKENSLNNIGVVYRNKNEHLKAIEYYLRALKGKALKMNNARLYAKLLDNLAYSKFKLNDLVNTEALFYESLKIRDSVNDFLGIAVNKLHLSEYYASLKDSVNAKQFALETMQLASQTKNYRELLSSLLALSKLDKENGNGYTRQYIELNDSLQKEERAIRNKFARIQFETDEFIVKNKRLAKEFNLMVLALTCVLLLGALTYVLIKKSIKNKELKFVQEQQKANEEIYNLMLAQNNKLDEGRKEEKKRISEELHDGVLGKLFGTRLILGMLNAKADDVSVSEREKYIHDLQEIEEDVRNVSHELNRESKLTNTSYTHLIDSLLAEQSRITNFSFITKYDEEIVWEDMEGGLKMNLYRIIQEAVQNINKYSNANQVDIEFKIENNNLSLSIKDDGIGFSSKAKRKGIGLKNIKSRANKFKGKLYIDSQKNHGTKVLVTIPV